MIVSLLWAGEGSMIDSQFGGLLGDKRVIEVCQKVLGFHSVLFLSTDIQPTNAPK